MKEKETETKRESGKEREGEGSDRKINDTGLFAVLIPSKSDNGRPS